MLLVFLKTTLSPIFVSYHTIEFKISIAFCYYVCCSEPEKNVNHAKVYLQFTKLGQALEGSWHDGAD